MRSRRPLLLCVALASAAACSTDATELPPTVELGVPCDAIRDASVGGASLSAALAAAVPGDCVVVGGGTYEGSFTVPTGVKLVGTPDADVELRGTGTLPALALRPGASALRFSISSSGGIGLHVAGGPAELRDLTVSGAAEVGLLVDCDGEDCLDDAHEIHVAGVSLDGNGHGLWVRGARVRFEDGSCSDSALPGLPEGYGVVASDGALLTMQRTVVARNEGAGVVVDGAGGTRAHLTDLEVRDNPGRGVWAQGLLGPASFDPVLPMLEIDGAATRIDGNGVVGIGAVRSRGILVSGVQVTGTVIRPVILDLGGRADLGDGIGLFDGTGAVLLESVELSGNGRSQLLVDAGAEDIVLRGATVSAPPDGLLAVVQRTGAQVEIPAALLSAAPELPVDSRDLPLPQ